MIRIAVLLVGLGAMVPGQEARVMGRGGPAHDSRLGSPDRHDVHVSLTRMVVEGTSVVCRIRLFKDDLEKALQRFGGNPDLRLTAQSRSDSLFGVYAGKTLTIEADGQRVPLRVSASGTERDPSAQEVVWYVLEGESATPPKRLGLLYGVMFEMFRDQQNLVQVLREPGGVRKTLYFVSSDPSPQTLAF